MMTMVDNGGVWLEMAMVLVVVGVVTGVGCGGGGCHGGDWC
ncbi:hypothetical protein Hanom_Chr12g01117521 [Helianthus anomalus]